MFEASSSHAEATEVRKVHVHEVGHVTVGALLFVLVVLVVNDVIFQRFRYPKLSWTPGRSVGNARNPQPDILVAWAKASHKKRKTRKKDQVRLLLLAVLPMKP